MIYDAISIRPYHRDLDKAGDLTYADGYTEVIYINTTVILPANKWGLFNKNTGEWTLKNSVTFEARGLCSRACEFPYIFH